MGGKKLGRCPSEVRKHRSGQSLRENCLQAWDSMGEPVVWMAKGLGGAGTPPAIKMSLLIYDCCLCNQQA